MPAIFYHCLHLISILFLVSALTNILLNDSPSKFSRIGLGIFSLIILVAGFGLIAKLGYSMHSLWLGGKLAIWLAISAGVPIIAKRLPHLKRHAYFGSLTLLSIAVILAFTKL